MTKQPTSRKSRMIHIRLDDGIHRQLKVHAARSEQSIQEIVEQLVRKYLHRTPETGTK